MLLFCALGPDEGTGENRMKRGHLRDRLAGSLAATLSVAMWLSSAPANAQCTLVPGQQPLQFEPNPPGVSRPGSLSAGFSYGLDLYRVGSNNRLIMTEVWGYSILDLSNPGNPTATAYHDMRPQVPVNGDGQSYVASLAVAPDGSRAIIATQSPSNYNNVLMQPGPPNGSFTKAGDFAFASSNSVVVQKLGSRYLGWALKANQVTVADITNFVPSGPPLSIQAEVTAFPGGSGLLLTGPYIVYRNAGNTVVVNASNPGATVNSYTTSMPYAFIPTSAWQRPAGNILRTVIGAVDPSDGGATPRLYLLGEFAASDNTLAGYTPHDAHRRSERQPQPLRHIHAPGALQRCRLLGDGCPDGESVPGRRDVLHVGSGDVRRASSTSSTRRAPRTGTAPRERSLSIRLFPRASGPRPSACWWSARRPTPMWRLAWPPTCCR